MPETALIGLRAFQYGLAAVVLGAPAFMIYGTTALRGVKLPWLPPAIAWAAALLAAGSGAALVAQTAVMTGSLTGALEPESLGAMIAGTTIGPAYVIRLGLALAAFAIALTLPAGRTLWWTLAGLGVLIAASFAWTGHGAATEGVWRWPHLVADIIHSIAALIWVGALMIFLVLLSRRAAGEDPIRSAIARALAGFARIGTIAVAALAISGAVNLIAIVGFEALPGLLGAPYGVLLAVKLLAFGGMLVLAAINRFRLTPAFGASGAAPLRRSVGAELALGLVVLALVGVMGVLPPPASP